MIIIFCLVLLFFLNCFLESSDLIPTLIVLIYFLTSFQTHQYGFDYIISHMLDYDIFQTHRMNIYVNTFIYLLFQAVSLSIQNDIFIYANLVKQKQFSFSLMFHNVCLEKMFV